ncbi:hypothetical protein BCR42DRAFT_349454 [Absidia repens]|uniref:Ubiquitin-like protease family profile domain-containing protein n=1 Tax=Absidia repens TaxID=90262 RepID=A0A1X2IM12_9FUNG|nr:hypothetical protein BCR42DRAFT_349454 [Absidia repens]
MHRRKINQEDVQPQEDTVVLLKSKRKPIYENYSLLPGQTNRSKKKGKPISIPGCQPPRPKYPAVSIDKYDPSSLFYTSEELRRLPRPKPNLLSKLKKADESRQRSIPKPHGSGKAAATNITTTSTPTMVLSSDDEDKHSSTTLDKTSKERSHNKKRPIHSASSFLHGKPFSSNTTPTTPSSNLSKKQRALGFGRLQSSPSSPSLQNHNSLRYPTTIPSTSKAPYHSFLQSTPRIDINHSRPYRKEQQRQQINQHRRFDTKDGEANVLNNEPLKKKASNTITFDTSDNDDDIYHSACSISSDADDHNSKNSKKRTDPTALKHNDKQKLIKPPKKITSRMQTQSQSLNSNTKHDYNRPLPTLPQPSLPPSSPLSSSSSSSSTSSLPATTAKGLTLHVTDASSPAPVELSDDEMDEVNDTVLFTYPINRSKGSITVTVEDMKRLEVDQFLNDSIIDFYLKLLMDSYSIANGYRNCNAQTCAATENTHIFSSFFYNRLTQGTPVSFSRKKPISYENVRKWTSKIDLFSKRYAIFPINENWHWYLVLVCNLDKCIPGQHNTDPSSTTDTHDEPHIFVLDSLGGTQRNTVANINHYLVTEAQHRRHVDPSAFVQPRTHYANVPKQDNSCDCGVFLLHFVDQFLNSPQDFIRILLVSIGKEKEKGGLFFFLTNGPFIFICILLWDGKWGIGFLLEPRRATRQMERKRNQGKTC